VAGDFSGDGRLDLASDAADLINSVSLFVGNGDGTFQPPLQVQPGIYALTLVTGDFTGNGRLDLAVSGYGVTSSFPPEISILLGNGNNTFQIPQQTTTGVDPSALVTGDFNGTAGSTWRRRMHSPIAFNPARQW